MTELKTPQDHKSKTPAQVEADGDVTIDVEWDGRVWTVPASVDDWSLETLEVYETNRTVPFLRNLLGPKQWANFAASKPRVRDLKELAEAIEAKAGYGEGE